ncbi:MAG: hypothetical protein NC177_08695 [Ruminococcus flavefaciens]|nr:hypothetical protein [Ruminococcus flavefaciens]
MEISDNNNTLVLIIVIVLFTVAFISSALITYKIRRKKSAGKSESHDNDNPEKKG